MNQDSISIHFVHTLLRGAQRLGLNCDMLLRQASIDPQLLLLSEAYISPEQYFELLQILWKTTQDESSGLYAQPVRLGTFSTLCQLIIHEDNLYLALKAAINFYKLFNYNWSISLEIHHHKAHLIVNFPQNEDPEHYNSESLLIIWHGLASWLIKRRIQIQQMHCAYPCPKHATEYKKLFATDHISYQMPHTQIIFDASFLSHPIRQNKQSLGHFLNAAPLYLLVKYRNTDSLAYKIKKIFKNEIGDEMSSLEEVALQLNLSSQTLRRRLLAEGKSYQQVKDNLRKDAAIELLVNPKMTLEDIAQHIGFCETSTFHRAFKRWTGIAPGHYRQRYLMASNS